MHRRRWPTDTEESVDKVMVRRGGWTGEENRSSRACGREVGRFDCLGRPIWDVVTWLRGLLIGSIVEAYPHFCPPECACRTWFGSGRRSQLLWNVRVMPEARFSSLSLRICVFSRLWVFVLQRKSAQSHGTLPASFRRLCRRLIPTVVPRETAALMWMAWWISRRMRAWNSAGIAFSALSSRRSTRYGFRRRKHTLIAAAGSLRLECLFLMPLRSVPYTLSLPGAP